MTYREKFHLDHPNGKVDLIHIFHCPIDPKTRAPVQCVPVIGAGACRACWDREMEVTPDAEESVTE